MKILYLVHAFYPESYSGTEKFVYNISKMMKKFNHDVKVITYSFYDNCNYTSERNNILFREFDYEDIPVLAFKYKDINNDYSLEQRALLEIAIEILKSEKPDLVHVGHSMRTSAFIEASIKLGIPYILTLTDFFFMCPKFILLDSSSNLCDGPSCGVKCKKFCSEIDIDFERRFKKAIYLINFSKSIVAPSNFVKRIFEKNFLNANVKVINHGIEYKYIDSNNRVYDESSKITFGYLGALTYHKGMEVIVKAFKEIGSGAHLKLYGSGNMELLALILRAENIYNIELSGVFEKENIKNVMKSLDVVIVPSIWHETYCFVIYEAIACNVPVIATDIGAIPEKIKNCINGFLFEKNDSGQLQKIIKLIIQNPKILNLLKESMKFDKQIPSIEQEAKAYEKEYLSLITNKNSNSDIKKYEVEYDDLNNKNYYLSELYYALGNKNENLDSNDKQWKEYINIISKRVHIDERLMYSMRYRLYYLKEKFKDTKVDYIIWGASNAGALTKEFLCEILPNFNLVGYIDKYKTGVHLGCTIYSPEDISKINFKYALIATTPGKEEAERYLNSLDLKIIDNYLYGYGVN